MNLGNFESAIHASGGRTRPSGAFFVWSEVGFRLTSVPAGCKIATGSKAFICRNKLLVVRSKPSGIRAKAIARDDQQTVFVAFLVFNLQAAFFTSELSFDPDFPSDVFEEVGCDPLFSIGI